MNYITQAAIQDTMQDTHSSPAHQTELPELVVPSISSSAVLVTLSRSVPKLTKIDKEVTREVTNSKHASKDAGKFNKSLVNSAALAALNTLSGTIYAYHTSQTIVWMDKGPRLLPNAKLIDYKNTMEGYISDFNALAEAFIADYPRAVADAQIHQGEMFKEGDYPSVHSLRSKIGIRMAYEPIPDVGDFRIDIGNQAAQEMRDTYNGLLQDRLKSAMDSVLERLTVPLLNMSKMLDYAGADKPTGFRDTLIDNVTSIVDLMKTCNVGNDPKLEQVRQDLLKTLRGVTPDKLRNSETLRLDTKRNVDEIIKNLPSLGF